MNEQKLVFKSPNGRNEIYDTGKFYALYIKRQSGEIKEARFEHSPTILKAVISAINEYGNAKWSTAPGCGPRFTSKYEHICTLGQIVYCASKSISLKQLRKGNIRYLDGDACNAVLPNIVYPAENRVEILSIGSNQYTLLSCMDKNGTPHLGVVDYDETLHSLLSDMSWSYHKASECLITMRGRQKYKLYHIVCAFAQNRKTKTKNLLFEKTDLFRARLAKNHETVDHKKAYPIKERWDNRKTNLQIMPDALNAMKNNCTRFCEGNTFYIPVKRSEIYGYFSEDKKSMTVHIGRNQTTKKSIEDLKYFCKSGSFSEGTSFMTFPIDSPEAQTIVGAIENENALYQEIERRYSIGGDGNGV